MGARGGEVVVYVRFWVRRKAFFFLFAILLPTGVITYLGASAILIAQGETPNTAVAESESPLSFLGGLMLTMMAMKFSYSDSLPKLGYLTMLDWYIIVSFTLLWCAAMSIIYLSDVTLMEWHAHAVYSCIFIAFNMVFFSVASWVYAVPVEKTPRLTFTAQHVSSGAE